MATSPVKPSRVAASAPDAAVSATWVSSVSLSTSLEMGERGFGGELRVDDAASFGDHRARDTPAAGDEQLAGDGAVGVGQRHYQRGDATRSAWWRGTRSRYSDSARFSAMRVAAAGSMAFTRMPCGAPASAKLRVRPDVG